MRNYFDGCSFLRDAVNPRMLDAGFSIPKVAKIVGWRRLKSIKQNDLDTKDTKMPGNVVTCVDCRENRARCRELLGYAFALLWI
jgi:hypothetical protein